MAHRHDAEMGVLVVKSDFGVDWADHRKIRMLHPKSVSVRCLLPGMARTVVPSGRIELRLPSYRSLPGDVADHALERAARGRVPFLWDAPRLVRQSPRLQRVPHRIGH